MKKKVNRDGFRPSHEELKLLAAHWAQVKLDVSLDLFYSQQGGGDWQERAAHAARRLARIARSAGEDVVRAAVAEVKAKARHSMGPEMWEGFENGSYMEQERVMEDINKNLDYLEKKEHDAATQAKAFAFLRDNPGRLYFDEAGDMWFWSELPPRCGGGDDGWLHLCCRTPKGRWEFATNYTLPRPARWVRPYGIDLR